jgi:polar amino acid transport system substrate-binding protein
MKKLIAVLLTVVLTASLAGCKSKSSEDTLIVGTEPGFAPYEYMDGNEIVGIDMDIVQAIADAMGKKLEVKSMDFEGALLAVQQGKVDLVAAGVSIDEERQKVMDFSNEYVNSTEVVVVNGDSPTVSSVEDLNDKIIGVQQGNIADFYVSNVDNVTAKEIKRYTKFNQAAEDLKNGKIDCIVMDQYPAEELVAANASLKILDGTLFEDKYAIAVKKGNKELLDEINKVIDQLKADGKIEEFTAKHTEAK